MLKVVIDKLYRNFKIMTEFNNEHDVDDDDLPNDDENREYMELFVIFS